MTDEEAMEESPNSFLASTDLRSHVGPDLSGPSDYVVRALLAAGIIQPRLSHIIPPSSSALEITFPTASTITNGQPLSLATEIHSL